MLSKCRVLQAKIFHDRTFPKRNRFRYRLLYLSVPISKIHTLSIWPIFGVNKPALMSFWNKDHGGRTHFSLKDWVDEVLTASDVDDADGEVVLITLPRLFGYVFNPVSFWLCYRSNGYLRAVIAEVNNTFGETHSYVCFREDGLPISDEDTFFADKDFHVSPFLRRTGQYRFKFRDHMKNLSISIDYLDELENQQLRTAISGSYSDWTLGNLLAGWLKSPLMAIKAIFLIYWQAFKLVVKSAEYQAKPEPHRWSQTRATTRLNGGTQKSKSLVSEEPYVFEYR